MEFRTGNEMANQKTRKFESVSYAQGLKCKNFKFVSKLQSLGLVDQWERLDQEMREERFLDMTQYQNSLDSESRFPIYVLFEVLHVQRKTPYDHHVEQKTLTNQLKMHLQDEWEK